MKILVLGGDGFLGSHFVDQSVALEHEVTVFDRFPYQVSKNLEHQRGAIQFISGEFANRDDLSKALEGQDIVYHFIWASTPVESWNDPFVEIDQNLRTSIQCFEFAVRRGVRKIVFPSSGGTVYGPQKKWSMKKPLSGHSPLTGLLNWLRSTFFTIFGTAVVLK
jgi:UDP-glucose 4-epimerase